MKLAVISDLHLAPGASNRCTAPRAALLDLFDEIEAVADRVLVGGDLFDLDRPKLPGGWRSIIEGVRDEFPQVVDRLEGYDWIFGNHDGQLCRTGVPEERFFHADGLRILARHGHQWDMPLKKLPALAPTANYVAGWFDRLGLDAVAGAMGGVPLVVDRVLHTKSTTKPGPDRSLRGARELIDTEGLDIVISGHSHLLRLVPVDGGLYVNTGSICCGFVDWVLIHTDEAHVCAFRDGERVQEAWREGDQWRVEGLPADRR
ncbi:hypothetical protein FIV42_12395 [Persicimonas caeni]|uniref:Calcineurin-like phosphoesterase domain-containing protein n=1 Tax=Persicimonas caeni TaxID=2292766 RepID=A0A4Y6PUT5_PERCE|nr:metallophosphoesterase family protein [Persicimonas caeni]QDG51515.1 hypothetical protein FIV42_12395 [Persicimonas caeni]QED32736.1 hypothetical protein FRD00_12390 [Persicimonas caeni]